MASQARPVMCDPVLVQLRSIRAFWLASFVGLAAARLAPAQTDLMSFQAYTQFAVGARVRAIAFHPDGDIVAVAAGAGHVTLFDAPTRRQNSIDLPRGDAQSLAFSRDGKLLAIGTSDGVAYLWDVRNPAQLRTLAGHRGSVRAAAFDASGDLLATGGDDHKIVMWNVADASEAAHLDGGHDKSIVLLTFVGRGDQLVSVGDDRRVVTWDVKNKTRLRETTEADPEIKSAAVSSAGDWLILGTESRELAGFRGGNGANRNGLAYEDRAKFYDVASGLVVKTVNNLIVEPISVSLSADEKYVAISQRDIKYSAVALYDVDRGVRVAEIPSTTKATAVAFSPNGRWLCIGDERGDVSVLATKGIFPRSAAIADLAGRKFSLTSSAEPLVKPSRHVRFAVLDLDANGVEPFVAKAIADELTNRLSQNPAVKLVERRRIDQILKEQNFEHSGRTDPAEAARIAKVLNVQKVVLGSVNKLGTTMNVYTQLVDVETAAIEGTRQMECRNCSLEDLPMAVSEMARALVAPAPQSVQELPAPPRIEIESPNDGARIKGAMATLQGRVDYSSDLEGVELVVNGKPYPASRLLASATSGRVTQLAGGTHSFSFVQAVPLDERNNVIAVRALSRDGNDEQRYVSLERDDTTDSADVPAAVNKAPPAASPDAKHPAAGPARTSRPAMPGLSAAEIAEALESKVPQEQIGHLADQFGITFTFGPEVSRQFRALGADNRLLLKLSTARRVGDR